MKSKQISITITDDLHMRLHEMAMKGGFRSLSSYLGIVLHRHAAEINVDTGKVPETTLPTGDQLFRSSSG